METRTSNLCCGCLAVDRRMLRISNVHKEQCYLQIITELRVDMLNAVALWLCWECEANLTKLTKFKHRVKHSYLVLNDFTVQTAIPQLITNLTHHEAVNIMLPAIEDTDAEPITTSTVKTETYIPHIKYETDDDDNQPLIDICSDNVKIDDKSHDETIDKHKRDKIDNKTHNEVNGKCRSKSKHVKMKRNGKLKIKDGMIKVKNGMAIVKHSMIKANNGKLKVNKSIFNEIQLTEDEIAKERNELALRDDFVNAMFRCERCLISFPNEDDMKDHLFKKHDLNASKHKCSICECSFNKEVAYNYHRSRHVRRYECSLCKHRCASRIAARIHGETVHLQSAAYELKLTTYEDSEVAGNEHNGAKEEKYACDHCPKVFGWKTSLRKHLETHRIEAGQMRRPYCEPCSLSFTTTANLQKHVKSSSKHQIQLKLRKMKETNPEVSNDKHIADIKTSINSKREMFPCAQCDKKFQWRGNLIRHLHSHAARAAGSLVCVPCDRSFSSIATYTQHMKISRKHATENDYKYMCSECGKKFANKTKLKEHVDWEHLKNYVHTCSDCQKVFKTHTSLYLHRQVVHRKANAEHLCENCGKSFPNQTKLRSHITALHTSESPYKCGVCGARFSWNSCLSRHLRRVHQTDK